jgi:RNA polymerase sigma factor (sigma-70 family)
MCQTEDRTGTPLFATTHWSVILAAGCEDSTAASAALETLCQSYWYPVYAYIRHRGHQPADSEDLTQAFFARLLEREALRVADPNRGRFRAFLLTSLQNFLANEWNKARARKRGGGMVPVAFDEERANQQYAAHAALPCSPAELYDRTWARTILEQVDHLLRNEYVQAGKLDRLPWLDRILSTDAGDPTYAELGRPHGLTAGAVRSEIHRLRARFRQLLRREVAHTVPRPEDIDDELRSLLAAVAG